MAVHRPFEKTGRAARR